MRREYLTARMAENRTSWKAPKQEYTTRFNPATAEESRDVQGGKSGAGANLERCRDTARDIRMLRRERQSARGLRVIDWFLAL